MADENIDIKPEPASANPEPFSGEPPKRRRGRPPGSKNQAQPLSETPIDGTAQPAQPQKRRRRVSAIDTEKLTKQVKGLHEMLAMMLQEEKMRLTDTEAVMLAESYAAVSREYDLALDGKTGALIQLAGTCAIIYLPRFAYMQKKFKQRKAQVIDGIATPVNENGSTARN